MHPAGRPQLAYQGFLELCRRCSSSRFLPQVDLEAALASGGSVTVLEFLAAAPDAAATTLVRRGQILKDAAVVRHRLPETGGGQLLRIPYLARETGPPEFLALQEAWTRPAH
jgi:hypothetical protein